MKIRRGFVSNSSSSSYICDISGEEVSGWDMSLDEAEMYQCEMGHTFCEEYALHKDELDRKFAGEDEESDDLYDLRYELPSKYCPLCNFDYIRDADMLSWLLDKYGLTKDVVLSEIRASYTDYRTMVKALDK